MTVPVWQSVGAFSDFTSTTNWAGIAMPSGVAVGDLLIASLQASSGSAFNTPAGWVAGPIIASGSYSDTLFYRIADGSEGASVTFTATSSRTGQAFISRVSGTDPVNYIDGFSQTANSSSDATNPSVLPSITTTRDDCLLLTTIALSSSGGRDFTGPGTRVVNDNTIANQAEQWVENLGAAGATGTRSFTAPVTNIVRVFNMLAIAPPSAAPTTGQTFPHGKKGTPPTTGQLFPRGVIL